MKTFATTAVLWIAFVPTSWSLTVDNAKDRLTANSISGVTVVTHGFTPFNDGGDYMLPMAQAIRDRLATQSSEPVWILDYDLLADGGQGGFNDANTSLPSIETTGASGHAVLVFDWAPESNETSRWWAEAAGDALFSLGTSLGLFDPTNGQAPPAQFIGHSFGTVVTTEAVERLASYGVEVDQVTLLDPHDFDQADVPTYDQAQAMSQLGAPDGYGATIWNNVVDADVYYQTRGNQGGLASLVTADPEGRPIPGAYNRLLDGSEELPSGNPYGVFGTDSDHSYAQHTFYTGTILGALPQNADAPAQPTNYNATGWAHSIHNVNRILVPTPSFYDASQDHEHSDGSLVTPEGQPNVSGLASLGLTAQDIDQVRWAPEFQPGDIVNGDFESGWRQDLLVDIIAGWSHHGGGGDSEVLVQDGNHFLQLDSNDVSRTHNWTYIPADAKTLLFDLRVADPSPDDWLEVLIGDTLLANVSLADATDWFAQAVEVPNEFLATVATFTVRLAFGSTITDSPEVDLDNFRFAVSALPGDYNQDGRVDAADYALWRNARGSAAGTLPNDINGGPIGAAQYATWRANYGKMSAIAAPVAAPTPDGICLILPASLFLIRRRRG